MNFRASDWLGLAIIGAVGVYFLYRFAGGANAAATTASTHSAVNNPGGAKDEHSFPTGSP